MVSLLLHAAIIGFAVVAEGSPPKPPKTRVYAVDIVSPPPNMAGEMPAEPPATQEPGPAAAAEPAATPAETAPEPAPPAPEPDPEPAPPREAPKEPAKAPEPRRTPEQPKSRPTPAPEQPKQRPSTTPNRPSTTTPSTSSDASPSGSTQTRRLHRRADCAPRAPVNSAGERTSRRRPGDCSTRWSRRAGRRARRLLLADRDGGVRVGARNDAKRAVQPSSDVPIVDIWGMFARLGLAQGPVLIGARNGGRRQALRPANQQADITAFLQPAAKHF